MKLMATINTDIFSLIVNIISSGGNEIILFFSENHLSLCIPILTNQIALWVGCNTSICFNKYSISSRIDNTIAFKCNSIQLLNALTIESSPEINMKLSQNKDFKYIEFEHNSADKSKKISQKVEITLLKNSSLENYKEPEWDQPSIAIKFPSFRAINHWVNEMKDINSLLLLTATNDGKVGLCVDNESVSVKTEFNDLEIFQPSENSLPKEVLIEIKKLKKILKVGIIPNCTGIIYIYDKLKVRFHFISQYTSSNTSIQFSYLLNSTSQPINKKKKKILIFSKKKKKKK